MNVTMSGNSPGEMHLNAPAIIIVRQPLCLFTSMELEPTFSQVPTRFQEHASVLFVGLWSSLGKMPAASQANNDKD
jgi:hypothetical protein